jgi:hypothetical protein
VEHHLAPADRVVDALVALDVALHQLDVREHVEQVFAPPGGEVVEHAHAVPVRQEAVHDVRTDETAPAGDQDLHGLQRTKPRPNLGRMSKPNFRLSGRSIEGAGHSVQDVL